MEGTSQNKTLEDVYGMVASVAQSQAELTCTVSELVNALKETKESVEQLTTTRKEKDGKAARTAEEPIKDAGARLTDTYELLEMILLDDDLPMEIVFFAQRVNKQFRSLIANSNGLQQKLFLQPIALPDGQSDHRYVAPGGEVRLNPLFAKKCVYESLPVFITKSLDEFTMRNGFDTLRLEVAKPRLTTDTWGGYHHKYVVLSMRYVGQAQDFKQLGMPGGTFTAGSWMQMYLTQPAVEVRLEVYWEAGGGKEGYEATESATNRTVGAVLQNACGEFFNWVAV
ncbi:hypothetical protein LTR15_010879 [Elasticomyces elasticus]|nr:hypothetical protein LTR15_010879 [Elasticomyces elasticus]